MAILADEQGKNKGDSIGEFAFADVKSWEMTPYDKYMYRTTIVWVLMISMRVEN